MKTVQINKALARKVLGIIDQGLCSGLGKQEPGQMCIEAAVCYAMGLPHGDNPPCVAPSVRALKIQLNDSGWSSNKARAKGMRRLAIVQLGTVGEIDEVEFVKRVARLSIEKTVPRALRAAAKIHPDKKHKKALETAAVNCENNPDEKAAKAANAAAYAAYAAAKAAAKAAAYAAAKAAYAAAYAADYAAKAAAYAAAKAAAKAAANAAYAAANAADYAAKAAAYAAANAADYAADIELSLFAEEVVQILIDLKAPGAKWLDLTEAA